MQKNIFTTWILSISEDYVTSNRFTHSMNAGKRLTSQGNSPRSENPDDTDGALLVNLKIKKYTVQ